MIMNTIEKQAKIQEIEKLIKTGLSPSAASRKAGVGKNWYNDNIKKLGPKPSNDEVHLLIDEPNKRYRIILSMSQESYDFYKFKAQSRDTSMSQLIKNTLGEAKEKGLI